MKTEFSRDCKHYRSTPRSMQTSKFGPYSTIDVGRRKKISTIIIDLFFIVAFGGGFGAFLFLWLSH